MSICKQHRSYKGKSKPRTPCEPCWRAYIDLHPTLDEETLRDSREGDERCGEEGKYYSCSKATGHQGEHVACVENDDGSTQVLERWD